MMRKGENAYSMPLTVHDHDVTTTTHRNTIIAKTPNPFFASMTDNHSDLGMSFQVEEICSIEIRGTKKNVDVSSVERRITCSQVTELYVRDASNVLSYSRFHF